MLRPMLLTYRPKSALAHVAQPGMWIGGASPPLHLLTGVRGYNPRNFFKLKVLVGEFLSILGLKINTFKLESPSIVTKNLFLPGHWGAWAPWAPLVYARANLLARPATVGSGICELTVRDFTSWQISVRLLCGHQVSGNKRHLGWPFCCWSEYEFH